MEACELVPDPVVNAIVEAAIDDADGFVLDGYPRNAEQAEHLSDIADLDVVLLLDVGQEELVDRLTGRRVCSRCGANYHVEYSPPEEPGVCDECGGELIQRDDDTEDTVRERLRVYEENTEPLVQHYDESGKLVRIDGEASPDEVWESVREAVDREVAA
jgi:adenylate kinase